MLFSVDSLPLCMRFLAADLVVTGLLYCAVLKALYVSVINRR